jgi:hypothetical protein
MAGLAEEPGRSWVAMSESEWPRATPADRRPPPPPLDDGRAGATGSAPWRRVRLLHSFIFSLAGRHRKGISIPCTGTFIVRVISVPKNS